MKINRQFCGGQRSDSGKFAFISGERKACLFDSENEKVIDTFSFSADAVTFDKRKIICMLWKCRESCMYIIF